MERRFKNICELKTKKCQVVISGDGDWRQTPNQQDAAVTNMRKKLNLQDRNNCDDQDNVCKTSFIHRTLVPCDKAACLACHREREKLAGGCRRVVLYSVASSSVRSFVPISR